ARGAPRRALAADPRRRAAIIAAKGTMMAELQIDFSGARALVIGIATYAHIGRLPKVDDAKDMAAVMRDPEYCGYGAVKVLEEDQATKEAILAELRALARVETPMPGVLIYFSGHG